MSKFLKFCLSFYLPTYPSSPIVSIFLRSWLTLLWTRTRALWHLNFGKGVRAVEYLLVMRLKHICYFLLLSSLSAIRFPSSKGLYHDFFLFYKLREQRAAGILASPKPELKTASGCEKWLGYTEGASTIVQNSNKFLLCQMPVIQGPGFQPRISAMGDIYMSNLTMLLPNKW